MATLARSRRVGPLGERENIQHCWDSFIKLATKNVCRPDPLLYPPVVGSAPVCPSATSDEPSVFETPRDEYPIEDEPAEQEDLPVPKQELLEIEMSRLAFAHHLRIAVDKTREVLLATDTAAAALCDQAIMAKGVDVQQLVAATYQCDFGNIIAGSTKKKVFKITNSSSAGVMSWSFDNLGTLMYKLDKVIIQLD